MNKQEWLEKRATELDQNQTRFERWVGRAMGRWCAKRDILVHSQITLHGYILDFYFPQLHIAVELDGKHHDAKKDAVRDAVLRKNGITVLRFANPRDAVELNAILYKVAAEARYRDGFRKKQGASSYPLV